MTRHYDLIVCRHVLEHIPYPSDVLTEIHQCMKDETLLYVEVPHEAVMAQSLDVKASDKKHWHEHINFFSIKSLEILLKSCGLTPQSIISTPIDTNRKTGTCPNIIQIIAKKSNPPNHH